MERLQYLKAAIFGTPVFGGDRLILKVDNSKTVQVKLREDKDCFTFEAKQLSKAITENGPLRVYDPGYKNIICTNSNISYIDGVRGFLQYRGYPIQQLASKSSFLQTSFLLIYGELPSEQQLQQFIFNVKQHEVMPKQLSMLLKKFRRDADSMSMLISLINAFSTIETTSQQRIPTSAEQKNKQIYTLLGSLPIIIASIYKHSKGQQLPKANENYGYIQNFLSMLGSNKQLTPKFIKALEVLLIVHAQHGASCSTSLVGHLTSAGSDLFTSIAAGAGALSGSKHGGASSAVIAMLQSIGSKQNIPRFLMEVRNKKRLLYGFGNRVYRSSDPRAKVVRKIFAEVFKYTDQDPLIKLALQLERIALADNYFITRKLYPNMDFYTSLIFRAIGLPTIVLPLIYCMSRLTGWLAHWLEFLDDVQNKLVRPRQSYVGFGKRPFIQLNDRQNHFADIGESLDINDKRRQLSKRYTMNEE